MAVRFRHIWFVVSGVVSSLLLSANAQATIIASSDFSTFTPGNLVGQNGWGQYNTQVSNPIQVTAGAVTWSRPVTPVPPATVNDQDAFLPFAAQIVQPLSGSANTVLNFDLRLSVQSAGTASAGPPVVSPSFFAAINANLDGIVPTTGNTNFQNARIAVQTSGTGFVFGTRVNGQAGYPFAFGSQVFNFNTPYALRAEINLVPGNANDFIRLFAGSDFDNLTLQATAGYLSGTVTDPFFGSINLSQFDSATQIQAGVTINSVSVTNITAVPEPSTIALLGVASAGIGFLTYRRRCNRA
jgi:hypothetical protein